MNDQTNSADDQFDNTSYEATIAYLNSIYTSEPSEGHYFHSQATNQGMGNGFVHIGRSVTDVLPHSPLTRGLGDLRLNGFGWDRRCQAT